MDTTVKVKIDTNDAERALGRLNSAIGALGFGLSAAAAIDFADSITNISNKLKQVTGTGAEFVRVQKQLYNVANQTGSAIADTTTLYQKMSLAQDTAGLTSAGVLKMTELVSKQMATVGMSTAETNSFLTQFGQAMASGRLQGDEFRSMMETNVPMMKMLAESMGVTIGELKNLGSEGKITAKDLTDAFLGSTDAIEKAAGQIDMTIGKAFTVLKNNAMQAFGEMESGSLVVKGITEAILLLANNLKEAIKLALAFVVALAVSKLASIASGVGGITNAFDKLNKTIRANVFVALLTAIVYVGEKIYSDIIEPMRKFGVASGVVSRYVAESLINAFLQVGEAAISVFPAIGKLIADSLTPGKSMTQSLKEIDDIYAKILTRRTVKLVSDEELKTINQALEGQKKVTDAVKQEVDLRKEAAIALSQQQKEAQKALTAYINGLERSAALAQDQVLSGKREAEVRNAIQEQADKLAVSQQSLTRSQRDQIVNAIRLKQEYEDIATTQKTLKGLADQITLNLIADTREREVQSTLMQFQSQVSKEIFDANRGNVEQLVRQNQLAQDMNTYRLALKSIDNDIVLLKIKDNAEREITQGLLEYQKSVSRDVYQITRESYELKLRERQTQELINNELIKAGDIALGGFNNRIKAIRKTEEAFESLSATTNATMSEEMLLLQSASIQRSQYRNDVARILGENVNAQLAAFDMESTQLGALLTSNLITKERYHQAERAMYVRYNQELTAARQRDIEQQVLIETTALNKRLGMFRFSQDEMKKIAADRAAFDMQTDTQRAQSYLETSATMFNALGKQNKAAFQAAQALNIAVALMNTYRAASMALATYPWPFSLVAVGAAVATGMAQVAAIRSQSYSGRALGGGVMGGGSYLVGERGPEIFTPATNGSITSNRELAQGGGATTVNFTIVANDTRGFDELITARRGLITQIVADAQLEKGRRL